MTLEQLKDLVDTSSKIAATTGGLVAAFLAIKQWRENVAQRKKELRWKQADQGKKIIDEIFDYEPSHDATQMIEAGKRRYKVDGESLVITHHQAISALRNPETTAPIDTFVRDCFDSLFYFTERIEQLIKVELVTFEDVCSPADYFVERMAPEKAVYLSYLSLINHPRTLRFLERFPAWRDADPSSTMRDGRGAS